VVIVEGLWLLPNSWDRWAALFEEAGFVALSPGWPDDPETVEQAAELPEVFANKTVGGVADHLAAVIAGLNRKPAIIGHSFGGLLTQILARRGLSAASVAVDPHPSAASCRCRSRRCPPRSRSCAIRLIGCAPCHSHTISSGMPSPTLSATTRRTDCSTHSLRPTTITASQTSHE